ncbi:MAG TPA: papain-like cysteine protease family protein [Candidatus Nitrosotalea sp.]|nr:papain-like cysteine protease family protein [Candidatus Nitrosotalea sp.]
MTLKFFLAGCICAVLLATSHAKPALANVSCGPWTPSSNGPEQLCAAGIPSSLLDVTAHDRQQASEWCWAASISGIFAYYGHPLSQKEIVRQAYGAIGNFPGTPLAILESLNRSWTDEGGRTFTSTATIYADKFTAAQDLARDEPLIVGSLGHAMILTAVSYTRYPDGDGFIQTAEVRDPWPYNAQRRALSPQEIAGASMLIRIRVR